MIRTTRRSRAGAVSAALALTLLAIAPARAAKGDAGVQASLPEIQTWKLDNGLEVAYLGVSKAPVVTVQVWYHVGSKEEPEGRTGMAHMFEHMLFKGTTHVRPEDHARHIDRIGGSVNAFTTQDTTAYHNTVPKEYLGFACQLEAERMRNLVLRESMIGTEREVVKEELRLRVENSPIGKGLREFFGLAFSQHPYRWLPIGSKADLEAASVADLQAFYDTYYVPNNALLVVVGDVTRQEVEKCANDWFASVDEGAEPPRPAEASPEPEQTEARRATAEPGQVGIVLGGYHIPPAKHADTVALEVLSTILSAGESSRLHKRLVRKDGVAVAAAGQIFRLEDPGLFVLFGVYLDAASGDKVEQALLDEIAKVRKNGVTDRELQKARNQLLAGFVFGLESVAGLAQQIGLSWINAGDPTHFLKEVGLYQSITNQDIKRVANEYLTDDNLTVVVIPPKGANQ